MQDLKLQTTLPALSFDFDGLKAWALGITEQYQGLVVQEDDITGIKSEMAGLNKIKKQLDDARKETVRKVSEPIKTFEGQVKEIVSLFDDTYRFLGDQVKAFEDRAREAKRHEVQFAIDAAKDKYGVKDLPIPIQDSWLNKTAKMKSVAAEVESIILGHIQAVKEAAALEQARRDRAGYIEEKCASLAKVYGFELKPSAFLAHHNLDMAMSDVGAAIESAYANEANARAARAEREAQLARQAEERRQAMAQAQASLPLKDEGKKEEERPIARRPPVPRIRRTVVIEFYATREAEVAGAVSALKDLCIAFESINHPME